MRALPEIKRNFVIDVFPKLNSQIEEKKSTFFIVHVKQDPVLSIQNTGFPYDANISW